MDQKELNRLAAKLLDGTASKEEEEMLHAWYDRQHPRGSQEFSIHTAHDKAALKNRIRHAIEDRSKFRPLISPVITWRRAAAVLVLFATAIGIFYFARSPEMEWISVSAPLGGTDMVILPDSSVVWLNAGTTLRYPAEFSPHHREVELLGGQAYFDVQRRPLQPFYVQTSTLKVTVLGTSFDVKSYPDEDRVSVAVRHGQVEVNFPRTDDSQILHPGYMVLFDKSTTTMQLVEKDADYIGTWTDGRTTFFNEPIPMVISALERKYNVSIQTDSSKWLESTLTLKLDQQPLEDILEVMKYIFGFEYQIDDQGTQIRITKE